MGPADRTSIALVESRAFGVSSRTLARRLAAEGLSFGEILSQLRSDLATHYLSDPNLPISEVAWLVGYQGVSAFSHGWTRMNPKKMRGKLLASH
jgi:AraC-like DNA-binding protein